jgi:HEAT repeat protein
MDEGPEQGGRAMSHHHVRRLVQLVLPLALLAAAPWHGGSPQRPAPPPTDPPDAGPPSAGFGGPKPGFPGSGGMGPGGAAAGKGDNPGAGKGSPAPQKPGGSGSSGATGAGAGGQRSRSMGASTGSLGEFSESPDAWEQWWSDNQDRFLDLRARLKDGGGTAPATQSGDGTGTRRASVDVVQRDILPVLFELVDGSNDSEILDSALIALGRCTPEAEAGRLLESARARLSHHMLAVQTSAVLALGIQGTARGIPLLGALMNDTVAGRTAVGGGRVPDPVRALAALSLGLGNHAVAVPLLEDLVGNTPDAEADLKACAITALGLTSGEAGNQALLALLALLKDSRLDARLAAQVPLAIARLDGGAHAEAVAPLLAAFAGKDTDDMVRVSCAIAVGRLASAADAGAIELLTDAAKSARDERTRHAALMALAEIGLRDLPDEARHAAFHDRLARTLTDALDAKGALGDRAWAALAVGVYGSGGASRAPMLAGALEAVWREQKEPSTRAAFALALGLARATDASPGILEDFREAGDPGLRGSAAQALGLLGVIDAKDELLARCADETLAPTQREQVAAGLALLGCHEVVATLLDVLARVEQHAVSASVARALGRIGDREAITALAAIARDTSRQPSTRGMACVALGLLGERGELPWNAALKETRNDAARVAALDLVLDIL